MIDLAQVGEHVGGRPGSRHLRGVYSSGSFDKETADAGGYVVTLQQPGPDGKPVDHEVPVLSVGALKGQGGTFYFAADKRFASYPGFVCLWEAGKTTPVEGRQGVSVAVAETVVNGQMVYRKEIDVTFRADAGAPPKLEAPT